MDWTTGGARARARFAGFLAGAAWLGLGVFVVAEVLAALWRPDPAHSGAIETAVTFAALLVETFTFHAGVALVVVGLAAMAARRRRLAVVVGLLVAATLGPAAWSLAPERGGGRDAGDLVVMSANVLYVNTEPSAFIDEVRRIDPDVVLIQEYRAGWSGALHEALGEAYPHFVELPGGGAFGEAVLSKKAFIGAPRLAPEGWVWESPAITVSVEHGGAVVEIVCVHLWAPMSWRAVAEQRRQSAMLGAWAETRLTGEGAPDAVILAGDFNAPYRSGHLRELRGAGLGEAHDAVGVGRGASWKPRRGVLGLAPGVRIDQIMYAGRVRPTAAGVGGAIGSDHRPVWASLRVE